MLILRTVVVRRSVNTPFEPGRATSTRSCAGIIPAVQQRRSEQRANVAARGHLLLPVQFLALANQTFAIRLFFRSGAFQEHLRVAGIVHIMYNLLRSTFSFIITRQYLRQTLPNTSHRDHNLCNALSNYLHC